MNTPQHIIAIRQRDIREADAAFADLMCKTEACFNERSNADRNLYRNCTPSQLENISVNVIKEVCPSTPFLPQDIKLVSGHAFPDIFITDYYGVEVKSTKDNKWTSTGSSIVESTRKETIERIYMLFGSLGGNPPAFKCRPYQDCLSNIAVTHSPRYLIDMELEKGDSIFNRMHRDYDDFRRLSEKEKIECVRKYYKEKAAKEHKKEMPWWMEGTTSVNISFYSDLEIHQKTHIRCMAMVLFPDVFGKSTKSANKSVALWLCNRYSLLCYNIRDIFSSGGKKENVYEHKFATPYPAIIGRLFAFYHEIKAIFEDEPALYEEIKEWWDFDYKKSDLFGSWKARVRKIINDNYPSNKKYLNELLDS